jgi:hypothetical protein
VLSELGDELRALCEHIAGELDESVYLEIPAGRARGLAGRLELEGAHSSSADVAQPLNNVE